MAVYFISDDLREYVKIGYSKNPQKRLSNLQTSNSRPLSILLVINGDLETESQLHDKFKRYRVRGEWFSIQGELEQWLLERIEIYDKSDVQIGKYNEYPDVGVAGKYSLLSSKWNFEEMKYIIENIKDTGLGKLCNDIGRYGWEVKNKLDCLMISKVKTAHKYLFVNKERSYYQIIIPREGYFERIGPFLNEDDAMVVIKNKGL